MINVRLLAITPFHQTLRGLHVISMLTYCPSDTHPDFPATSGKKTMRAEIAKPHAKVSSFTKMDNTLSLAAKVRVSLAINVSCAQLSRPASRRICIKKERGSGHSTAITYSCDHLRYDGTAINDGGRYLENSCATSDFLDLCLTL